MVDNSTLPVSSGTEIFRNKDRGGVKFPVVVTGPQLFAVPGTVLTRLNNVTAYSANASISNSTTIGSVTPLSFTISDVASDLVALDRLRVLSTDTGVANTNVRAWLYNSDPTANSGVQAGDGSAFSNKMAGFVGTMSGTFRAMQDGSVGVFYPDEGADIKFVPGGAGNNTVWVQYQTLGGFTPLAQSTFTPTLEGRQGRA